MGRVFFGHRSFCTNRGQVRYNHYSASEIKAYLINSFTTDLCSSSSATDEGCVEFCEVFKEKGEKVSDPEEDEFADGRLGEERS